MKNLLVLIVIGVIAIPIVLVAVEMGKPGQVVPQPPQVQLSPEEQAKINAEQAKADEEWRKSKAGQICAQHKGWMRDDCNLLAEKKIWVGMKYDMLVYLYGKPNAVNPSNYGGETRYQYCWNRLTPGCFYDNNGDSIIDAFN